MCEKHEEVLSDVHIFLQKPTKLDADSLATDLDDVTAAQTVYRSRFRFRVPSHHGLLSPMQSSVSELPSSADAEQFNEPCGGTQTDQIAQQLDLDEDGDLVVDRPSSNFAATSSEDVEVDVVTIDHCMATPLMDVGLQVWQGSLLMCDFILHHGDEFKGHVALELGGGLGLSSIAMGMFARTVFCTDVGDSVLARCKQNIDTNRHLLGDSTTECDSTSETQHDRVIVRELDWTQDDLNQDPTKPFSWSNQDNKALSHVTIIFAADVVYDNNLTDAFFKTLRRFMKQEGPKTAYISMERRLNFTLSDLDVTCKEYDHFRSHLDRLTAPGAVGFSVCQIPTDFPLYFDYERVKQLELWKITKR